MFEYRVVIVATYAAQAAGVALLSLVLFALWRRYRRQHLACWSASFACLLLFQVARILSLWGFTAPEAGSARRLGLHAVTSLSGVLQPVLLLCGALALARRRPLAARAVGGLLFAGAALAAAGTLTGLALPPEWRLPVRVGVVTLASAGCLTYAAATVGRSAGPASVGRRVAVGGFLVYACSQAAYLAATLPIDTGPLFEWLWMAGFGDVVLQAVIGLGLVVWHLEEEHESAERAAETAHRRQEALVRSRRLEAVGRLAGQVAHDCANQISVVLGHCDLARPAAAGDPELRASLEEIGDAAQKTAALARRLMAVGRREEVRPRRLDLAAELTARAAELRRLLGPAVRLEVTAAADTPRVDLDPDHFDRILLNLVLNARDALGATEGRLRISLDGVALDPAQAEATDVLAGEHARWVFEDDGPGFDAEALEHAFEPFFTTKAAGGGSGLGLASVYSSVRIAGGTVEIGVSAEGRGARIEILLPAARGRVPEAVTVAGSTPAAPAAAPSPRR